MQRKTVAGSARFVSKNFDGQESVKVLVCASFLMMIGLWLIVEVVEF